MKLTNLYRIVVRSRNIVVAALLAVMLVLAGCAVVPQETQAPSQTTGSETAQQTSDKALFGDFKAQDTEGNTVTNDIFANDDVTMVNIWASFCGPCADEMPGLAALNEEYKDRSFQVVGIILDATDSKGNVDDATLSDAMDVIANTGANYLHIIPSAAMLGAYLKGITSVPTTVFVNSAGEIIGSAYVGSMEKEDWAKIIEGMLG